MLGGARGRLAVVAGLLAAASAQGSALLGPHPSARGLARGLLGVGVPDGASSTFANAALLAWEDGFSAELAVRVTDAGAAPSAFVAAPVADGVFLALSAAPRRASWVSLLGPVSNDVYAIEPAVALRLGEGWALGAGLPVAGERVGLGVGAHAGLSWSADNDRLRAGLSYRSAVALQGAVVRPRLAHQVTFGVSHRPASSWLFGAETGASFGPPPGVAEWLLGGHLGVHAEHRLGSVTLRGGLRAEPAAAAVLGAPAGPSVGGAAGVGYSLGLVSADLGYQYVRWLSPQRAEAHAAALSLSFRQ